MRYICSYRRFKWLASLVLPVHFFFSCTSNVCAENLFTDDFSGIDQKIKALSSSVELSSKPIDEARKFLNTLVNDINETYGFNLSLLDAFKLFEKI